MKKNNPNFKKISSAFKRGWEICKERGIKVARGTLFRYGKEGKINCACSWGIVAIGVYGPDSPKLADMTEKKIAKHFKVYDKKNSCLTDKLGGNDIDGAIINANDAKKMKPEQIIEALESCKL